MKHLYIIGNGFDIHHHIPSTYKCFRDWLEKHDSDTYNKVNEILGGNDITWWNEFESNLGNVFGVKLYSESVAIQRQPNYGSDEFRERDLYEAEYEITDALGGLMSSLKDAFQEWVIGLPYGDGGMTIRMDIQNSVFLTFNYSLTLEKMYGIPTERVLHIHGSVLEKDSIIVGHGRDYETIRMELNDELPDPPEDLPVTEINNWYREIGARFSDDYPTTLAKDAAATAMLVMKKEVSEIIKRNNLFFQSLNDIDNIHIYGFSFAKVDLPYIEEVVRNVDINRVDLEISYYNEKDKERAKSFFDHMHIPRAIRFVKLTDLLLFRQLKLF